MGSYIPSTAAEQQEMLSQIGLSGADELFAQIPDAVKIDRLDLPDGQSEMEVSGKIKRMAAKNRQFSS